MAWTKNQEAAININDKTILVSAAAGSGKTAVLVQRIVDKILNKDLDYSIDDLLIMTFTKAAASSMKERIKKALEKALEDLDKRNKSEYKRIKKEVSLVDMARISTIDSFCMSIVKENIDKVDIDPSFSIASEEDLKLLRADVLEEYLEEEYERAEEDFLFVLDIFAKTRGDDGLAAAIEKIYFYSKSKFGGDKILEDLAKDIYTADKIEEYIFDETKSIINRAIECIKEIEDFAVVEDSLAESLYGKADKKKSTLGVYTKENNEKDCINTCQKAKDIYEVKTALKDIKFHTLRISKKVDEDITSKIKELRDEYKTAIKTIKENLDFTRESLEVEYEFSLKLSKTLVRLTKEFSRRLLDKKIEKKILDFNDVALYALDILWNGDEKTDVALSYAKEFKEIYVDEYQDSNYIQEKLIEAIETNNIFMVGDVKQSIYRFRQAKPELFVSKYDEYPGYDEDMESKKVKVVLSDNFRSRKEVLDSINAIFYKIMSKDLGNIDYDKLAALNATAKYEYTDVAQKTKLYYINQKALEEDKKDKYSKIELEAKLIGKTIENLILSKKQIEDEKIEEIDGKIVKTKILRDLEYRDIVILLRNTKDKANIIVDELSSRGIPCYANSKTGFFDTYEIQKLLSMLSIIDNPSLEISLCSYLKSPIVDLDDRAIAILANNEILKERDLYKSILYILYLFGQEKTYADLFISQYDSFDENKEKDRLLVLLGKENIDKILLAFRYIETYRKESLYTPLHILIRKILVETEFMNYIAAMPYGDVRKANLLLLIEKAKSYEESGYTGLYNFIRYISELKEQATDFGEASLINENANTVRIMTIHASKGLEYPICILANLATTFGNMDQKDKMILDDKFGLGFEYKDMKYRTSSDSIKKRLIKDKISEDMKAEELRLLYVAMTRAKDLLIMTACGENIDVDKYRSLENIEGKHLSKYYIKSANSYLTWILMSKNTNEKYIDYIEFTLDELEPSIMEESKESETVKDFISLDNKDIEECINFEYKDIVNTKLQNKFSVSELKRKNQVENDTELKYQDTKKEKTRKKYSPTERGNAYHRFMDLLDFSLLEKGYSLEDIRKNIEEEAFMSKEELELVDLKDIEILLKSELGKSIYAAALNKCLFREQQFYMGLSARELDLADSDELILVQGVVDAYIETEEGIVIIDYKTDKIKTLNILKERYDKQLDYYAKAISASTDKNIISKILWSFELGKELRY